MYVLGIMTVGSIMGGTRPILLALLLVAVFLILAGCIIALLTLRNQRKNAFAPFTLEQLDSETD
jgi:hypothetical protein